MLQYLRPEIIGFTVEMGVITRNITVLVIKGLGLLDHIPAMNE